MLGFVTSHDVIAGRFLLGSLVLSLLGPRLVSFSMPAASKALPAMCVCAAIRWHERRDTLRLHDNPVSSHTGDSGGVSDGPNRSSDCFALQHAMLYDPFQTFAVKGAP